MSIQVSKLGMVGVNGKKFPAIRQHLNENIGGVYKDMDLSFVEISGFSPCHSDTATGLTSFQSKERSIPRLVSHQHIFLKEYMEIIYLADFYTDKTAIDKMSPGEAVIIFTPDSKARKRSFMLPFVFKMNLRKRHALSYCHLCNSTRSTCPCH